MSSNKLSAPQRAKRVSDQIQRELSDILRQLRDPRIPPLTVMSVDVSRDMSWGKVYITALSFDAVDQAEIEKALNKAAGFIRSELGQRLSTYTIPKLKFIYDASVERGIELSQLIDQAVSQTAKDDNDL